MSDLEQRVEHLEAAFNLASGIVRQTAERLAQLEQSVDRLSHAVDALAEKVSAIGE